MKNLQLESMLIVSHREKTARKIDFDEQITVIKGSNDTGKSSIVKSIPWVFGAEPHKIHSKWKAADIAALLKFSLDGEKYSIYRHKNSFSLFDASGNDLGTFSSVTNELGPVLAKLFNFKLKLTSRDGHSMTPPPAYLILPFYIDQDKGWTDTWTSFKNLGQFANWKNRVAGYHFGLRPDRWYALEAEKGQIRLEREEPSRQLSSINAVKGRALKELARNDFDINIIQFKNEIKQLLDKCNSLIKQEHAYRETITELRTEKIRLEAQVEIVAHTHNELSSDYKYALEMDESVGCPTCGAEYHNSFTERFEIAQDTQTCNDLLASLRDDLRKIEEQIISTEQTLNSNLNTQLEIRELLSKKQGKVKLRDLINIQGKKSLISHLESEAKDFELTLQRLDKRIEELEEKMSEYDSISRRKDILSDHAETFRKYAYALGVHSLSDGVFNSITSNIEESGSDMPRAILAYYFSAIRAIKKNGNATLFPLIIDAPNQQEQDNENLKKILNFINKYKDENQQVIIALVEDAGVKFRGEEILFNKKYSVLSEDLYPELSREILYYESKNLSI